MEKKKRKKISNRGVGAVWSRETHAPGKANKSQYQHDFLHGGLVLLPHNEGRVITPCSEPASPHKPYNTYGRSNPNTVLLGCWRPHPSVFSSLQLSGQLPVPTPVWVHSSSCCSPPPPPSSPVISHPLIPPPPSTSRNWITVWCAAGSASLKNIHKINCILPRWCFKSLFPFIVRILQSHF